jgi:hypothetical protein
LNGAHQLLVYADYNNLLDETINLIRKFKKAPLNDGKEIGLFSKRRENYIQDYVSPQDYRTKLLHRHDF